MANTVATGAVLGMLGMDLDILIAIIKIRLKRRGAGYQFKYQRCDGRT